MGNAVAFSFRQRHDGGRCVPAPFQSSLRLYFNFPLAEPRGVTIVVEGTPHEWNKPEISYVEVVTLFDPTFPQHPETTYSVKYRNGPSRNPEGILAPGSKPVKVKEGMKFNVSPTGQS